MDKKSVINAKTNNSEPDPKTRHANWWVLDGKKDIANSLFGLVKYIRDNQLTRIQQSALHARMYGNLPIWNYMGVNLSKMSAKSQFPNDRPTYNVVQSCTDTLVSRMTQTKPRPMFLTEGGDYKKRKLAKDLNKFMDGEFYQCRVYEKSEKVLRNSCIFGDGFIKIYESDDNRVALEQVLATELYVDESDGMYDEPQQLYQLKIVNRDIMAALYPEKRAAIMGASASYFDNSSQSVESVTSQIMVVEAWHLKSASNAKDGRHVICVENMALVDEEYDEDDFPFVKFPYAPRPLGYFAQGMPERLMGLQISINQLLYTQHIGLYLCGIPKWLIEDGSKVVSAHVNNQIGGFIKYQGTPPVLQSSQVFPPEIYQQLERYINMAFQQEGISQLSATSQKPAGLNSGKALREYDDLQTDRFASLSQRYEKYHLDLADKMFKLAKKISIRDGKYETIYPGDNNLLKIDLPEMDDDDDFIIQMYPVSGYSKQPAFKKQEVVEDMQAGLIDPEEGRRLLNFPDLKQVNDLLIAPEERILQLLDKIIEEGEYTPPDPYMDLAKAKKLTIQYYNKYLQENLEEEKAEMLRTFLTQCETLTQAAAAGMQQMGGGGQPMAAPEPQPVSPMVPNVPVAA